MVDWIECERRPDKTFSAVVHCLNNSPQWLLPANGLSEKEASPLVNPTKQKELIKGFSIYYQTRNYFVIASEWKGISNI